MKRSQAMEVLRKSKPVLIAEFGVTSLASFGSTARYTAKENSDVDILVAFDGPATSQRYVGVQFFLEDLLGGRVDLSDGKSSSAGIEALYREGSRPCLTMRPVHGISTSIT